MGPGPGMGHWCCSTFLASVRGGRAMLAEVGGLLPRPRQPLSALAPSSQHPFVQS